MAQAEYHRIRDPVHGFILFDQLEKDLIDSRPFQRLRRIKQLAMTYFAYPGAMHTRFEHSLGVMEVATQLFDALVRRGGTRLKTALNIDSDAELSRLRRILRIAALLHDIGHPPFSHASEELLPDGHEAMTARIIEGTEIREIVENRHYPAGIRVKDILPVAVAPQASGGPLDARSQFLNELITGIFGADRIDYLLRDSVHTGVKYGQFDASRLIHTLTFTESPESGDPVIALDHGGIHAAEGLILARYFMFQQVYFHKVRRIYDYHLARFLNTLLPMSQYPQDLDEYLTWDDVRVEQKMQVRGRSSADQWASILVERNHFRAVFQAPEGRFEEYLPLKDELSRELKCRFGDVTYVDALATPLAPAEGPEVPVISDDKIISSWEAESRLFTTLPLLGFFRVYARNDEALKKSVQGFCRDFFECRFHGGENNAES